MKSEYYVYIMANLRHTVLYTGITNNIERRVWEHKQHLDRKAFTSRYNCDLLVWYCSTPNVDAAIAEEKRIKAGSRAKKVALIEKINPQWHDLAADWYR